MSKLVYLDKEVNVDQLSDEECKAVAGDVVEEATFDSDTKSLVESVREEVGEDSATSNPRKFLELFCEVYIDMFNEPYVYFE